jgi:hypothetical protein
VSPSPPGGPQTYQVADCNSPSCGWEFFDPIVAVGYRYKLVTDDGQNPTFGIVGIQVPTRVGDGVYDIFLCKAGDTTICDIDTGQTVTANDGDPTQNIFDVVAYLEGLTPDQLALLGITDPEDGITAFALRGIDPGAGLDPNDPLAFVTGLLFTGVVDGNVVITPEVVDPPDPSDPAQVPEPASLGILASSLLLFGRRRRRRR